MIILVIVFYLFTVFFSLLFLFQIVLSWPRKFRKTYSETSDLKVLIILPCRGIDFDMESNLRSILNQQYRNRELIAVIDSEDDPAAEMLSKNNVPYIISNFESKGSGKVRAIATALEKFKDFDVYIIADSDIEVQESWLSKMVAPLADQKYGISTTFPYFEPVRGFWSKFKTAWGFVGNGMMQSDLTVFGWGGSLAFRKDLIGSEEMVYFSEHVSDDMAITDICHKKKLKIAYVPDAGVVINSPDDWITFKEWSLRQTSLLLSKDKKAYTYGILIYGSSALLILGAIFMSVFYSSIFLLFFIPLIMNEIKMYRRLRQKSPVFLVIQILLPFFYVWNLRRGSKQRTIQWRGRNYDLYSTQK